MNSPISSAGTATDRHIRGCALALLLAMTGAAAAQTPERIANEGTIGDAWMLAPGVALASVQYPPAFAPRHADACIALGYRIAPDGSTSDFQVLRQWNSEAGEREPVGGFWQAFASAGADAVGQWKFAAKPGTGTPVPTRTVATLGFQGGAGTDPAALRAHCRIDDLAGHLSRLRRQAPDSRNPLRRDLERERDQQRQRDIDEALRRVNGNPRGG